MVDHGRKAQEREDSATKAAARLVAKLGARVEQLDRYIQDPPDNERFITEVRFKVRYGDVGDVLGVLKADTPDGKVIAFHSDDTVAEVLSGLVNRLNNGSIKWREDTPYGS